MRLPPGEALELAREVLRIEEALATLHEGDVVGRGLLRDDLKKVAARVAPDLARRFLSPELQGFLEQLRREGVRHEVVSEDGGRPIQSAVGGERLVEVRVAAAAGSPRAVVLFRQVDGTFFGTGALR